METRNGLPVRIICWDRKHGYPIVGLAYEKATGCESYVSAYTDGTISANGKMELSDDLFILTQEEELSEFEQKLWEVMKSEGASIRPIEKFTNADKEAFHSYAAELLAIARKELREELQTHKDYSDSFMGLAISSAYERGKAEALKDLPRWKEIYNAYYLDKEGFDREQEILFYHGNQISINELKKLPGFKEDEK